MSTPLGEKIRALRRQKGLTLDELAALTTSSKSYIWELENKEPPRPSAEKLSAIASRLGVTIEFLMDKDAADPTKDVIDQAFYRSYQKLRPKTKERIRELVGVWSKEKL